MFTNILSLKRLSEICYQIGYLSAHVDEDWADEYADTIVEYITKLFTAAKMYKGDYHGTQD